MLRHAAGWWACPCAHGKAHLGACACAAVHDRARPTWQPLIRCAVQQQQWDEIWSALVRWAQNTLLCCAGLGCPAHSQGSACCPSTLSLKPWRRLRNRHGRASDVGHTKPCALCHTRFFSPTACRLLEGRPALHRAILLKPREPLSHRHHHPSNHRHPRAARASCHYHHPLATQGPLCSAPQHAPKRKNGCQHEVRPADGPGREEQRQGCPHRGGRTCRRRTRGGRRRFFW